MSGYNLPPGTTQAMIDRYYGDDEYEPTEQELEEGYLDQIEQEAAELPAPVFYECLPVEQTATPVMTERKWTEFQMFLEVLTPGDLDRVVRMSGALSIKRQERKMVHSLDELRKKQAARQTRQNMSDLGGAA